MRRSLVIATLSALTAVASAHAQDTGGSVPDFDKKKGGSTKMHRLANVPAHTGNWKAADVELEQDRNRPYAYLSGFVNYDVTIYDISNPSSPKQIYRWSIDNPELQDTTSSNPDTKTSRVLLNSELDQETCRTRTEIYSLTPPTNTNASLGQSKR